MAIKQKTQNNWLQLAAMRATRVHFVFIAAYIGMIIMFDTWNLLPHEAVAQRWTAAVALLVFNTVLWFFARNTYKNDRVYMYFILALVIADIIFAAYNVFWERGMASKSVVLFIVPLITAAATRSRSAVIGTGILSVAAYSTASVRYFNLHYGEGFRVELYGNVLFYSALYFVIVWLLFILIRPNDGKV